MMSYADQDYHRRRSEMELERAVEAEALEIAYTHLELARLHRARRQIIAQQSLEASRRTNAAPILRADKEA